MEVKYNVTGARRKELAQTISEITGAEMEYRGVPTFAYEVDFFTVTKDGTLEFPDRSDTKIVEQVLSGIADAGFGCEDDEGTEGEEPTEGNGTDGQDGIGLTVSIPIDKVSVPNLERLLEAKGNLIKKALGIDTLRIATDENEVSFPWFEETPDADEADAYTRFIAALCNMSLTQKRVTATAREVENEKYAFRCFLLRLGFIGTEYKAARKILLRNLSGSSAFRDGERGGESHAVSE